MNGRAASPIYVIDGARTPFLKATNRPGVFSAGDLARPGGMVTGVTNITDEIHVKFLELLLAAAPRRRSIGS